MSSLLVYKLLMARALALSFLTSLSLCQCLHLADTQEMLTEGRQGGGQKDVGLKSPAREAVPALLLVGRCDLGQSRPVSSSVQMAPLFPGLQRGQAHHCIIIMILIVVMAAVYSFKKVLLSIYSGPGPVLGAGDSSVNRTDKSPFLVEITFSMCNMP